MSASLQLGFHRVQLRLHPRAHRSACQEEASGFALPTDVREAEEVERCRFPESVLLPMCGRVPAELDQARLLGMQFQGESPQPLAEVAQKPLSVRAMLESHNEVVGVARDDDLAAPVSPAPLLDPQVEGVMQVDVRQQGRNGCPLRSSFPALRPLPVFHHSRGQPLTYQSQESSVRDPMLNKPQQPPVIDGIEQQLDILPITATIRRR